MCYWAGCLLAGFTFFPKNNIQTVADLKKSKPWMWEGDPLVEKTYSALGIRPVPLSITDVLLSLQTGMIDTGVCLQPGGSGFAVVH